jgi:hypothetical protein
LSEFVEEDLENDDLACFSVLNELDAESFPWMEFNGAAYYYIIK